MVEPPPDPGEFSNFVIVKDLHDDDEITTTTTAATTTTTSTTTSTTTTTTTFSDIVTFGTAAFHYGYLAWTMYCYAQSPYTIALCKYVIPSVFKF